MRKYVALAGLACALVVTFIAAVGAVYAWRTGAHLYRNVGVSLPPGFYLCLPVPAEGLLPVGAIVEVVPPTVGLDALAAYLPSEVQGLPWLKRVVGRLGETICLVGTQVLLEAETIAGRSLYQRYPIPDVEGCWTLGEDDVFLMGSHPRSFDARYTGPWARASVKGVCQALWIWEAD